MPAPLIFPILTGISNALRLPALAKFFGGLFAQTVAFFTTWFAAKTAMQLGAIAAVVALTLIVFGTIKALLFGVSIIVPPYWVQGMSMIVPSNAPLCLSAIVSAQVVRWVWIWQVHFIEFYAKA